MYTLPGLISIVFSAVLFVAILGLGALTCFLVYRNLAKRSN